MGSIASCSRRTAVVNPDVIRVVQLNGQVDEFPAPVRAKRVLQNHLRHFICCSRDLYTVNFRSLQPDEELRLGELYFLLPFSALESAENLVALAARLFAAARKEASRAALRRRSTDSTCDRAAPRRRSTDSTCDLAAQRRRSTDSTCDLYLISKSNSWRPRLHTIPEIGFTC